MSVLEWLLKLFYQYPLLTIGGLLAAGYVVASLHKIGPTEVGLVTKRFSFKKLAKDNPVAFNGEAGYQADLLMPGLRWKAFMMTIQLERDMRFVEIAALLTLLVLFLCYAIPISRNLRGILFGYGLFLGINILNLTLMRRFGADVQALASYVQSFTYIFVLGVWTVLLWSPSLQTASGAPADGYQGILQQTNSRLGKTRSFVRGALGL